MREHENLGTRGEANPRVSAQIAPSHRRASWRSAVIITVILLLAASIGQSSAGHTLLERAGLLQKPATYTSLAFLDPAGIPQTLKSKRTTIEVAFVIRNSGGIPDLYDWSLSLVQKQSVRHVATGNVRLRSGHAATISRLVRITCSQGQVQIVVSLTRPAEDIHARATCKS